MNQVQGRATIQIVPDAKEAGGGDIVCRCYVVTRETLVRAIRDQQLRRVEDVTTCTNAAGGCGSCYDDIQQMIRDIWGTGQAVESAGSGLTASQKRAILLDWIRTEAQPLLTLNGLEMDLLGVEGDRVLMRFRGAAVGSTQASFLALKWFLVQRMSELCDEKMHLIEMNVLEDRGASLPHP